MHHSGSNGVKSGKDAIREIDGMHGLSLTGSKKSGFQHSGNWDSLLLPPTLHLKLQQQGLMNGLIKMQPCPDIVFEFEFF